MAREEHPRENLLADATAFAQRIEFRTVKGGELFIGFRPTGAASVYVDQDPVYHFNSQGLLRRAYMAGELLKADRGQLVSMHRHRHGGEVQLVSRVLDEPSTSKFLEQVCTALEAIASGLDGGELEVVGQVPEDADLVTTTRNWLRSLLETPLAVADEPHAT